MIIAMDLGSKYYGFLSASASKKDMKQGMN